MHACSNRRAFVYLVCQSHSTTIVLRRYMRGMRLRWPLKKFTNGRPVDLINFELKAALLAAGYAVVTIDVRGTGQPSFCAAYLSRQVQHPADALSEAKLGKPGLQSVGRILAVGQESNAMGVLVLDRAIGAACIRVFEDIFGAHPVNACMPVLTQEPPMGSGAFRGRLRSAATPLRSSTGSRGKPGATSRWATHLL